MKDIITDEDAIKIIDKLKFALKNKTETSKIANALDDALNIIINNYILDQDSHSFASIPNKLPPPIKYPNKGQPTDDFKQFCKNLLAWVPREKINCNDLIARCLNNLAEQEAPRLSDIKAAILELKEEGEIIINLDNSIMRTKQMCELFKETPCTCVPRYFGHWCPGPKSKEKK